MNRTGDLLAPRYGSASLAELVPSVTAALTGTGTDRFHLGIPSGVIVLVVDGLGAELLDAHARSAPFLSSMPGETIDAPFPTTTATSLATIGTGRPPGQHGLLGLTIALADHAHPLNLLSWRIGLRGGGGDARENVVPETFQPHPTAFEAAARLGVSSTVVVHPDFVDSGLTRAALRGGQRLPAVGLSATLEIAVAVAAARNPSLVYAHHGELDSAGHAHGPGSARWCEALAELDQELERAAEQLPPGVLLLVTADHGMVTVPDEHVFELSESPELFDGVRVLAGEPRVRHVHTDPGAAEEVASIWKRALGGRSRIALREEAITEGWFGTVEPDLAPRIGDVVAVAVHGSMAHHRVDPHHGRQLGQHGGLSPGEVRVPLRRIGLVQESGR